ncbi:hypothetical protein [Paenibacillus senegalimassiliensis]|uniref:hypothetical protein n=1 Tax=Paenibacillus senegalimassiliensis TaxID=1737426 RepID=UPI00073F1A0B|nr:hypothetical protein [Paenibacillus senegalimassiliensis]
MFEKIQFEPGQIVFDELQIDPFRSLESQVGRLKEDLFQVVYDHKFIVDVGWYPSFAKDGHFRVVAIQDFNWEVPVFQKTCRTVTELRECVEEAVKKVKEQL